MKKMLISLLMILGLLSPTMLVGQVAAVNVFQPCSTGASSASVCKDAKAQGQSTTNPVIKVLKVVIQLLALVIGLTSVIVIIVSGLRMITANGDAQSVSSARNGLLYALIGLVVAISAQALVAFVINKIQ